MILSPNEQLLGFLHPKYVDVTETIDSLTGLRIILITHPLLDNKKENLNYYNNLLEHGNKVFWNNTPNGDGCLYVLQDNRTVDQKKNTVVIQAEEVATELNDIPPIRFSENIPITIDSTFINTNFGSFFTAGTIETCSINYIGTIGLMALLTEITTQTKKEIQFSYEYSPDSDIITRYIDIVTTKGKVHTNPVEIGYNTQNIILDETEATMAIAAAPTGKPSDITVVNIDLFNVARAAFEAMTITVGQMIPSSVDSSGVESASIPAPYAKSAGANYIQCPGSDSAANYQTVQEKEKQSNIYPRTITFDTSETNMYNLYWLCVTNIKAHNQPSVTLTATVLDIQKMKGNIPEYYNRGDTVYLKMPGRVNRVQSRVIKTSKNPRTPDKDVLTIGNYLLNFFRDYSNIFINRSSPYNPLPPTENPTPPVENPTIRAIYIRGSDYPNIVKQDMITANITDIYIKANHTSTPGYATVLPYVTNQFADTPIRVHAWITYYNEGGVWHYPNDTTWNTFVNGKISDIVTNYAVDGVLLDAIRYSGTSPHKASEQSPVGHTQIVGVCNAVKTIVKDYDANLTLTAAVMPEMGVNAEFYGQDYTEFGTVFDVIAPMTYLGNYSQPVSWIGTVVDYIKARAVNSKVIPTIQTYNSDADITNKTEIVMEAEITEGKAHNDNGYALFRMGLISSYPYVA